MKMKKKEKVRVSTINASPYNVSQLRSRRRRILMPVTENKKTSLTSDIVIVENCTGLGEDSCCSSNGSELSSSSPPSSDGGVVFAGREVEESEEGVTSTNFHHCRRAVAVAVAGSARQESNGPNSPARKMSTTRSTVEMRMPSDAELEDFFSSAEKDIHKSFSDKYNFDIVKDVPLEGRYEWVEIKP